MRDFHSYWTDPGYWRWRWQRVGSDTKLFVLLAVAAIVGLGGYLLARGLAGATETSGAHAPPVPSSQGIATAQSTIAQTTRGQARAVTPMRQRTVALPNPVQTIVHRVTVKAVTDRRPGRVLTRPVTVSGPTQTVTKEVTQPAGTVTGPTRTVTNPETTTNTVNAPTVPVPVAVPTVTVPVAVPTVTVPTGTVPVPVAVPTVTLTVPTGTVTVP